MLYILKESSDISAFSFEQVAPVLRYFDSMRYGVLSRVAKYRYNKIVSCIICNYINLICREERATDQAEKEHQRRERVKWYEWKSFKTSVIVILTIKVHLFF